MRRPDRKQDSIDAVHHARVCSQHAVNMHMTALVEQMQIIQTQLRRETIRVVSNMLIATGIQPVQLIVSRQAIERTLPFEQVGIGQP